MIITDEQYAYFKKCAEFYERKREQARRLNAKDNARKMRADYYNANKADINKRRMERLQRTKGEALRAEMTQNGAFWTIIRTDGCPDDWRDDCADLMTTRAKTPDAAINKFVKACQKLDLRGREIWIYAPCYTGGDWKRYSKHIRIKKGA